MYGTFTMASSIVLPNVSNYLPFTGVSMNEAPIGGLH